MILDRLENIMSYRSLNAKLDCAIRALQSTDFAVLEVGRYELDGENVYFMIQEPELRALDGACFEAHRRYADIQLALSDGEIIRYAPTSELNKMGAYDDARDIVFFDDAPAQGTPLRMRAETFAIFFPQDAHMPCLAEGACSKLKKLVIKVLL